MDLDEDSGSSSTSLIPSLIALAVYIAAGVLFVHVIDARVGVSVASAAHSPSGMPDRALVLGAAAFSTDAAGALAVLVVLMALGALFAAAEVAFISPRRLRLEQFDDESTFTSRVISRLGARQGPLLTAILVGHVCVAVLYALVLAGPIAAWLQDVSTWPPAVVFAMTAVICTIPFVLLCEAVPRVIATRYRERTTRAIAVPLQGLMWLLLPVASALIRFINVLFRVTRFHNIRAAPFITDEELKTAVSASEARGVLEQEEGQMIQGILKFGDALLREILVPRPDIVALPHNATVREALECFRQHEFSRMPVYEEDLDHVVGLLVAKDLMSSVAQGALDRPVSELMRAPRFVPDTMTAHGFVRDAQRMQMHLAIVVDEYGGTGGLVTLEDAIEQVVGDIRDQNDIERELVASLGDGRFRVDGGLSLDQLSALLGVHIADVEHETVGGFVMSQINKIPEKGDRAECLGARFTVEEVEGKRVSSLTVEVLSPTPQEQAG